MDPRWRNNRYRNQSGCCRAHRRLPLRPRPRRTSRHRMRTLPCRTLGRPHPRPILTRKTLQSKTPRRRQNRNLTEGNPAVTHITTTEGISETSALALGASLATSSLHPLSKAIVKAAHTKNLTLEKISDIQDTPGQGIAGKTKNRELLLGQLSFLEQKKVNIPQTLRSANSDIAGPAVWLAEGNRCLARFDMADPIRSTTPTATHSLKNLGIDIELLTGDQPEPARAVASQLGITRVQAGVKPDGKAARVSALIGTVPGLVAMAGDGTNDAPPSRPLIWGFHSEAELMPPRKPPQSWC